MSRALSQSVLDALAASQGLFHRVLTWADQAAYEAAPTVPEAVWLCTKFDVFSTSAKAVLISDNDYVLSDFSVFVIERGPTVGGVEQPIESGLYFVRKFVEKDARIELEGSSYPDEKITLAADGTYQETIELFCLAIGKTAVFADPGAAWLGYQFMADGESLVLNRAERFEQIIRQKYLIQCYERAPGELVFYSPVAGLADWQAVLYADSRFVAVADGGNYRAASSADGTSWAGRASPVWAKAVAYSSALDLYAAVGTDACATSPDGVSWTARTMPAGEWRSVAWDATIAKFVAVGYGQAAYSADGLTWTYAFLSSWTSRTAAAANSWQSMVWAESLGLFVAVSTDGTSRVMTSPDGVTWTSRSAVEANEWQSVAWSESLGLLVAVSSNGTNRVMTSSNGTSWTARAAASASYWTSVVWADGIGLFVAVGGTSVMTSPNGVTWTSRSAPVHTWQSVAWSESLNLLVGVAFEEEDDVHVMTSSNGIDWTGHVGPTVNANWTQVVWVQSLSLFVAVSGYAGSGERIMTSPDGEVWTPRTSPAGEMYDLTWSESFRLLVAVGNSSDYLLTSPDGVTWTLRTGAAGNNWNAVVWADSLGLFAAVSSDGASRVMTLAGQSAHGLTASGAGQFAAVGASACVTSTNGTSWTARTIPAGTYYAVGYKSSLYVAVGASVCASSTNGTSWTARTIPTGTWRAVTWSAALSLWVAVGDAGKIATSADGASWTARTGPTAWDLRGVAASGSLLVAVSSEGMLTSTNGTSWTVLSAWAGFEFDYADGPSSSIVHGTSAVHFVWTDESGVIHTQGNADDPPWGLGYLESTDDPPGLLADPFYRLWLQVVPVRLDVTDGDRVRFTPRWALDPVYPFEPFVIVEEHFDASKSPSWWQEISSIALFDGVEGGGLPASVARSGAYIPLVSSGFNGNLDETVTNVQALAERVDDLPTSGGYTPPATTAADDFQVGDGAGNWITKTLAQTVTILRTALDSVYAAAVHTHSYLSDAPSDSVYYGRRNAGWTNLKTYFDTLYQAVGSYVTTALTISTTAPLSGGGDLSANRTLTISAATTSAAGSMSAADKTKLDGIPSPASSQSVLASAFSLTGTAGTYQDTGLSVSLPAAGTYRVVGNVRGSIQGDAGTSWWITCKLYNSSDGADVANSERVVAVSGTSGQLLQNTCPIDIFVTVAAAKTIKLYAFRNGTSSPTWTTSFIGSDGNGRTAIGYQRIG